MIIENHRPERPANSQEIGLSDEIWNIMQTCWDPEPSKRPKIEDVVKFLANAQGLTDHDEILSKGRPTPPPADGNEALLRVSHDISSWIPD
jgi:hypothetical protein